MTRPVSGCTAVLVVDRGRGGLTGRLLGRVPAAISHRVTCDGLGVHATGRAER